jgi:8-oxo-dGTP diphosphatase
MFEDNFIALCLVNKKYCVYSQSVTNTLWVMESIIGNLSVDCVVFGLNNQKISVLLTKRELKDPSTGKTLMMDYTVQGHHVLVGENVSDAAVRVLREKTGLDNIFLKQFYTFGDRERLSNPKDILWRTNIYPIVNDHVISVGYFALVDSARVIPSPDYSETSWFPVKKLPELGYDHKRIIMMALEYLREEIRRRPIIYELLPEKFTLTQLQNAFEAILGIRLDKRNFRKKVAQMKYIIELDEKQNMAGNKPAQLYLFSQEVYDRTKKEKLVFLI